MSDLNHRARKILQAVVQEYLHTGEAVGSRTVTRRHGIDLSPATVRNVMADLEELGLLRQPHTSAGRVPTASGLRLFIDSLLKVRALSSKEKEDIRLRYGLPPGADFDEAMQRTSRLLSELSHQAAVIITPLPERQRLQRIEFVRLRERQLLAVLVSDGGHVDNKLLAAPPDLELGDIDKINNYLNALLDKLDDRSLEDVRTAVVGELGKEKNQVDQLAAAALRLGQEALTGAGAPDRTVIVSGSANLVEAAVGAPGATVEPAAGLDKVRRLLEALEEKERIISLLDRTLQADGIQVWLGAETPFASVAEVSVVASGYGPEDKPVGTIAVIGPTYMNYSKVIPLVDFTAELVTGLIVGK
jgi:heat-inducible transcriptional repressor